MKASGLKHGLGKSPEFVSWSGAIYRCHSITCRNYKDYGGRGIKVCKRWRDSFLNFFVDMGPKPSSLHSLDRINNNKGYSPSNCRWATRREQNTNQRVRKDSKLYILNGKHNNLRAWCIELGLIYDTVWKRINLRGMPFNKAIVYRRYAS